MITVFYDGKCGLCRREIAHYIKIVPVGIFEWVDITTTPEIFIQRGFTVQDGLKALHVEDNSETMRIGVAAFIVIWQHLPHIWKLLYWLMKIPFVLPLTEFAYRKFSSWRFKTLGYEQCSI